MQPDQPQPGTARGAPEVEVLDGRFEIGPLVGAGSFGQVFRARDLQSGASLAVKRIRADVDDPITLERFDREARLLARVAHPHVVRYVAHGCDADGRRYLALEWLAGQDLAEAQRTLPLTRAEAVEATRQAAQGLAALHALGVVHRDVKPSNLFVLARGDGRLHVKVLDLGIARASDEPALTLDGARIGTPAYMSPEQASASEAPTPASDVFSLGAVLYELLTGQRPFPGSDAFAVLAQIALKDPARPRALAPTLPQRLEDVVLHALARAPHARYPTGAEFAAALAAPDLLLAPEAPAAPRAGSRPDRERRVVAALFARIAPGAQSSARLVAFTAATAMHRGQQRRTLGGGVIAVFGAERSSGDEHIRAARTALAIARGHGALRLSLVTCRVTTGDGALTDEAIEWGATRAETDAPGIVVDAASERLLHDRFVVESSGGQSFLRGARDEPLRAPARVLGRSTPLVARERELAALDACFADCVEACAARVVLLAGDPGVGKSRLRYAWLARIQERAHFAALHAQGDPSDAASPLGLLAQLVRHAIGVCAGDSPEARRTRVEAHVAGRVTEVDARRITRFLAELVGAPFPDAGDDADAVALRAARRDPKVMADQLQLALQDWLALECAAGPLVLVLEDLHWADAASLRMLSAALRALREHALMVLGTTRLETQAALRATLAGVSLTQLPLGPLPRRGCERLAREILGADAPSAAVARIASRCGGNALFLEEMARAGAGDADVLPATVQGVVQARLDALGADARAVLRAASVFGEAFWSGAVHALLAPRLTSAQCDERLRELEADEHVVRAGASEFPGEVQYAFPHALLRESARATFADDDLARAHLDATRWLEARGETRAAVLAEHCDRGGEPARAAVFYARAAEQALDGDDPAGAIAHAERAVACGAAGEARGRVRLLQALAYETRGAHEDIVRVGAEALELFPRGSDPWLRVAARLASAYTALGAVEPLRALAREAFPPETRGLTGEAAVFAAARLVTALGWRGLRREADELRAWLEGACAEGAFGPGAQAQLHAMRAHAADLAGRPDVVLHHAAEAAERFARIGDQRGWCKWRLAEGYALVNLGDAARGAEILRAVLARAERIGHSAVAALAQHNLGLALAALGELAESERVQRAALAEFLRQGDAALAAAARLYLARVLLAAGDPAQAVRLGAEVANAADARPLHCSGHAVLARAHLERGASTEALAHAELATQALSDPGAVRESEGFTRLVHADALRACGREADAQQALAAARAWLLERAAAVADRRLRESWLRNVAVHARILALTGGA